MLIAALALYPALLAISTKLLNAGYTNRYGEPAILGLVLGAVYLCSAIRPKPYAVHILAAFLICFAIQAEQDLPRRNRPPSQRADEPWSGLAELSRAEPDTPVVIGSGSSYLEWAHYAPAELSKRLVEIVDPKLAIRLVGTDSVDSANILLAQFVPLRVEDATRFLAAHQRFILSSRGPFDWVTPYLIEARYHLRLVEEDAGSSVYIVER